MKDEAQLARSQRMMAAKRLLEQTTTPEKNNGPKKRRGRLRRMVQPLEIAIVAPKVASH